MAHPYTQSLPKYFLAPPPRRSIVQDERVDAACRALNVVVAAVLIIVTLPLMALIAVAIKATSRGPVLYRQQRVGWNRRSPMSASEARELQDAGGMPFTIYKFRTMVVQAPGAKQVWAAQDDPRVTKVGRWLRTTRLDELPQLFNVLLGDMNVVGPRPEQPDLVRTLVREIREYPVRLMVLPGITGLAQVTGGYDASIADVRRKVALDIEYLRRRSPLEDLRIMALTPMVMFLGRGAR